MSLFCPAALRLKNYTLKFGPVLVRCTAVKNTHIIKFVPVLVRCTSVKKHILKFVPVLVRHISVNKPSLDVVAVSQVPSLESNPNSPLPVIATVGQLR